MNKKRYWRIIFTMTEVPVGEDFLLTKEGITAIVKKIENATHNPLMVGTSVDAVVVIQENPK